MYVTSSSSHQSASLPQTSIRRSSWKINNNSFGCIELISKKRKKCYYNVMAKRMSRENKTRCCWNLSVINSKHNFSGRTVTTNVITAHTHHFKSETCMLYRHEANCPFVSDAKFPDGRPQDHTLLAIRPAAVRLTSFDFGRIARWRRNRGNRWKFLLVLENKHQQNTRRVKYTCTLYVYRLLYVKHLNVLASLPVEILCSESNRK